MSKGTHRAYIFTLSAIVLIILAWLIYTGQDYYQVALKERFYHDDHQQLKPSGVFGHGYGIMGSLALLIGVGSYMARKRWRTLSKVGVLKHWLEFHIFLCTLGPLLILFHTAFKFGGIVAISFWAMVAVFVSGIIGRFIYLQIPRTIQGRELSLNEVKNMKSDLKAILTEKYQLDEETTRFTEEAADNKNKSKVKSLLKGKLPQKDFKNALKLVNHEISLNKRIERLNTMQNLFKYWHVVHLPFALIMLVIMIIHVVVVTILGYRWIF
ncbi:MAG: hypothetical protein K9I94_00500 [Bacteroidales bacterium]|nr:hypothetical protein [Bacteroidales bacterium]